MTRIDSNVLGHAAPPGHQRIQGFVFPERDPARVVARQSMTELEFVLQYVLNRASTLTSTPNAKGSADAAREIWKHIMKLTTE